MNKDQTFWTLVVGTVLLALLLLPSAAFAMMSPMMFDSGETPLLWVVFLLAFTLPVTIIVGAIVSWVFYSKKKFQLALYVIAVPFVQFLAGLTIAMVFF